jgi:hypothetical protein
VCWWSRLVVTDTISREGVEFPTGVVSLIEAFHGIIREASQGGGITECIRGFAAVVMSKVTGRGFAVTEQQTVRS